MELCQCDLQKYLDDSSKQYKFDYSDVMQKHCWIYQLLKALEYLEVRQTLHRDLKPENIMMVHCGKYWIVKLADFGSGKVLGPNNTGRRTLVGSPLYMAPDLWNVIHGVTEQSYQFQIDVWSMGLVFFQLQQTQRDTKCDCERLTKLFVVSGAFDGRWGFHVEKLDDLITSLLSLVPPKDRLLPVLRAMIAPTDRRESSSLILDSHFYVEQ